MVVEMLIAPRRVGTGGDFFEIGLVKPAVLIATCGIDWGDLHTIVGQDFAAIVSRIFRVGR